MTRKGESDAAKELQDIATYLADDAVVESDEAKEMRKVAIYVSRHRSEVWWKVAERFGIEERVVRESANRFGGNPRLTPIRPAAIRRDGGTQLRLTFNGETVDTYAAAYKAGEELPPPAVFHDGTSFWPGDGHQRIEAALRAGLEAIVCDVRPGTLRDAILHAAGANASHGDRRTQADARNAVETMLKDEEWGAWSDRRIAKRCGVTHPTVAKVRQELAGRGGKSFQSSLRTGADGRTIDVSGIGARSLAVVDESDDPEESRPGPLPGQTEMDFVDAENGDVEEEEEDEEEDPPKAPDPADVFADRWIKVWHDINVFYCSLPRRGGIVNLVRSWSPTRIKSAIHQLRELADTCTECADQLERTYGNGEGR